MTIVYDISKALMVSDSAMTKLKCRGLERCTRWVKELAGLSKKGYDQHYKVQLDRATGGVHQGVTKNLLKFLLEIHSPGITQCSCVPAR